MQKKCVRCGCDLTRKQTKFCSDKCKRNHYADEYKQIRKDIHNALRGARAGGSRYYNQGTFYLPSKRY